MIKITDSRFKIDKDFFQPRLNKIEKELEIPGNIVIKIGSISESKKLNLYYLNKDFPTDVLSFPMKEKLPDGYYLGDIFICYPMAEEQAIENHSNQNKEILRLMIHGILHLLSYDHEHDSGEMFKLQEEILVKYY